MHMDDIGPPFRLSNLVVAAWLVLLALSSQQAHQAGVEAASAPLEWHWAQPPRLFPPS